jgi:TonB family protein
VRADETGVNNGRVRARLTVTSRGYVSDVQILESSPPGLFDVEARRALRHRQYNEGMSSTPRFIATTLKFRR